MPNKERNIAKGNIAVKIILIKVAPAYGLKPLFSRLFTGRFFVTALLVLLGACATAPRTAPPRATGSDATPAVTAPRPGLPDAGDAVDGLLAAARKLRAAGDLAACFARLERALRIAPQRAEVYLELARAHLAAGAPERAAGAAQRGLAFCQGRVCRELRAVTEA